MIEALNTPCKPPPPPQKKKKEENYIHVHVFLKLLLEGSKFHKTVYLILKNIYFFAPLVRMIAGII